MKTEIIISLTFLIAAFVGFWGTQGALAGQEQVECTQWQTQAKTYAGFYLTRWQKEQCGHYHIIVEAPVQ